MVRQPKYIDPTIDLSSGPGPSGYVEKCLRKSFKPKGRATRAEFWSFVLFVFLLAGAAGTLGVLLEYVFEGLQGRELEDRLALGAFLITLPALFCVTIRRLHDCGREGQAILVLLLPFIGVLILLGVCLLPSQMAENPYGLHPKTRSPETDIDHGSSGDVFA